MPTCPTRLIVNPLAILTSSLRQARPWYGAYRATGTDAARALVPLARGPASHGEYHTTDYAEGIDTRAPVS